MKFSIGDTVTVKLYQHVTREPTLGVVHKCHPWHDSTYHDTYDVTVCDQHLVPTGQYFHYVPEYQLSHWSPNDNNAAWDRAMKGI